MSTVYIVQHEMWQNNYQEANNMGYLQVMITMHSELVYVGFSAENHLNAKGECNLEVEIRGTRLLCFKVTSNKKILK